MDPTDLKIIDGHDSEPKVDQEVEIYSQEVLESKLDEACNKILMIMQARFTEAMLAFERKMSALIDKLMNIPTIFSSCLPEPSSAKLKRANVSGEVARAAKKPNGGSRSQHEDDVAMDEDQSTSEFVARIIETQSRLIDNGTANLISNANAKKLRLDGSGEGRQC
ncbi:hypothetical protein ACOME3_004923 [Neoechinorhynchus agilis]